MTDTVGWKLTLVASTGVASNKSSHLHLLCDLCPYLQRVKLKVKKPTI